MNYADLGLMMPQPQTFMGFKLTINEHAVRPVFKVERWPTKKRRRNYRVVKYLEPCAYLLGKHTWVVHPSLRARLLTELGL